MAKIEVVEERAIDASQLKSGVKLRTGHKTVLVVHGIKGTPPEEGTGATGGPAPRPKPR